MKICTLHDGLWQLAYSVLKLNLTLYSTVFYKDIKNESKLIQYK